jgi:CO/xanthine dehydrogenase FAD-binding subunit
MRGYLPHYDLVAPRDLAGALALVAEPGVRVLAGGTDVMVELAAGKLPGGRFVDLWQVDELRGIAVTDEVVSLGALTTFTDVRTHALLAREFPMLGQAARESGAIAIQNRGTIAGNIANASPAADTPPALLAYGAAVDLVSVRGRRRVPYRGFHTGYKTTVRAPDEIVAAIVLPRRAHPGVHVYRKVGTRKAQAIAKVGLALWGHAQGGRVLELRIGLSSVGPTVLDAQRTAASLIGRGLDATAIADASAALRAELVPIDDVRSTAHYRRTVAERLLVDALAQLA